MPDCPVCGHDDQNCEGPQSRTIVHPSGEVETTRRMIRVPKQTTRIGKAGYIGRVEEYDRKHSDIKLVQEHQEALDPDRISGEVKPETDVKPKRKKKEEPVDGG